MKKIIMAFVSVFIFALSAAAYVDNQYMTSEQYMKNTGFSSEMGRIIKMVNQDPYREPYVEKKNFKNIVKRAYSYVAPGTFTDIDFYNHDTNFDNPSWKDF